jgi:hypothetical protein
MAHQKIWFRMQHDEAGHPPFDVESLWAEENSDGRFTLDNIPFFASVATLGDVVEVGRTGAEVF